MAMIIFPYFHMERNQPKICYAFLVPPEKEICLIFFITLIPFPPSSTKQSCRKNYSVFAPKSVLHNENFKQLVHQFEQKEVMRLEKQH